MPDASAATHSFTNPPIDYAVAVWLGMPHEQILQGLRDGSIRGPQGTGADRRPGGLPDDESSAVSDPVEGESRSGADRSLVRSWFARLDPTLDDATFAKIWNEAGSSETARAAALTTFVSRAVGVATQVLGDAASPHAAIMEALDSLHGTAQVVRLDGKNGTDLEGLARHESGLRRALAEHSPWAVIDNRALARRADPDGRFDRFDPDTGEANLSDAWIGDRARHAAWRMASVDDAELEVAGDGWRFVDRAAGNLATVEIQGDNDTVHQVIFASHDGDRVVGGSTTDRIHGGVGDDLLRGRAGDDLLEGGRGDDVLLGGGGRDELVGQQGDDELEGGASNDRLDGGSGNDELAGGRGEDVLRGGAGEDVYRFESGDGADTIHDDGGTLVLDDIAISGTMRRADGAWESDDGRVRFALEGADAPAVLTVHASDGGNAIRLEGWRQGAYGITLDEIDESTDGDASEGNLDGEVVDQSIHLEDTSSPIGDRACAEVGNEAPCMLPDVSLPDSESMADLSSLLADPLDGVALIDASSLMHAAQSSSIPSPPDVDAAASMAANVVTASDIADALAEAGDEADSEAATTFSGAEWWNEMPMLRDPLPSRLAPDALLRRMS